MQWHSSHARDLPWKKNKDPYVIWVSEIILQQTRVEQGLPYFSKFLNEFPDLESLANASEDRLMQVWQGLGYYSRARNMHHTAKHINFELGGKFPDNRDSLIKLKGIGAYTAAAISSFAFDNPDAVVDGNVVRVISRVFGLHTAFDTARGKKEFQNLADELIDSSNPGGFNQAMMDFGSLQCRPSNPTCSVCPFSKDCYAYQHDQVALLPTKKKKIEVKDRYFVYFVLKDISDKTLIRKRNENDIWKSLYEFPLSEISGQEFSKSNQQPMLNSFTGHFNIIKPKIIDITEKTHLLSHQRIKVRFITIEGECREASLPENIFLVDYENLCNFAFPKIIDWFIVDKLLPL